MEFVWLATAAFVMEVIDSALGMMFGTLLSPLLIIMNYSPKDVVPSLLISQAVGGFIASWRHQRFNNGNFGAGATDRRIAVTIIWFGLFACVIGVSLSVSISPKILNTYIGLLVTVIGVLILGRHSLVLTDGRVYLLGFISAFNKALSGGGFGPLVAGGQLIFRDRCEKGAIASTDFAEAPICLFSFLLWVCFKGFPPAPLWLALSAGAAMGGFFGPRVLSAIANRDMLKKTLGVLVLLEGVWVLYKVWGR